MTSSSSCWIGSWEGTERLRGGRGEGEEYVGGVEGVIDSNGDGGAGASMGPDGESEKNRVGVKKSFNSPAL